MQITLIHPSSVVCRSLCIYRASLSNKRTLLGRQHGPLTRPKVLPRRASHEGASGGDDEDPVILHQEPRQRDEHVSSREAAVWSRRR